ncbi:hypothetical protein [Dawidia soli]|uniref:Uncharacterized protein n=1 Tax=Dawidia soli TaxID=2782352 RepID=A0AAP2DG71_9BACT|nr:hypothetical protein [Dawidia soli]MBT1690210.1 hypothetical protein [Dawidia soli]
MDKNLPDEIDLMELLAKAYRGIKRHLILFIVLPVVGAAIALLISYNGQDKYASSMMLSTDLISKNEAEFIVKELEAADSIMPGLTRDEAQRLLDLRFTVDSKTERVPVSKEVAIDREVIFLKITAEVTDPSIFPSLERKLVRYMNSIDPVVQNRKRQEFLHTKMIAKLDSEIVTLDGIRRQSDSRAMAEYINPASLFSKTIELYEDRTQRELRLQDMASVHLTKGFGSLMKDSRLPRTLTVILGFVAGLFTFVIIMFVQYFNQYNSALKE